MKMRPAGRSLAVAGERAPVTPFLMMVTAVLPRPQLRHPAVNLDPGLSTLLANCSCSLSPWPANCPPAVHPLGSHRDVAS